MIAIKESLEYYKKMQDKNGSKNQITQQKIQANV
jgi:hypothetical protein